MSITYLPPSGQVCDSGCLRLISAFSNLPARDLKSSATCVLGRVKESSTKELRSQISLLGIAFSNLLARDLKSSATCVLGRVEESSTNELRSQISLLGIGFGFLTL